MNEHELMLHTLQALAAGLGCLFVMAIIGVAIKFSLIPLYIVAGIVTREVIPHTDSLKPFGLLGILFLMFLIGLEFSIKDLIARWKSLLTGGAVDFLISFPVGYVFGIMIGLPALESLFLACIVYPTSTAIVSRALMDTNRLANSETPQIFNVLVVEDLVIAVLMVALQGAVGGGHVGEGLKGFLLPLMKTTAFCLFLTLLGLHGNRLMHKMLDHAPDEVFLVGLLAFLMFLVSASVEFGLSEAVGALLAGMIIGGTELRERAEALMLPLQHLFAALFFLGFGLLIQWRDFIDVWPLALMLAVLSAGAKILTGRIIGRINKLKPRARWRLAFSLVPRGEFSVVLANIAAVTFNTGTYESRIPAVTGLYVLLTSVGGLLLITHGEKLLPKPPAPPPSQGLSRLSVDRVSRIVALPKL